MTAPVIVTGEAQNGINLYQFYVHGPSLGPQVFSCQIFNHFSNGRGNLPQTGFTGIKTVLFLPKYIYKYRQMYIHGHTNICSYTKQGFLYMGKLIPHAQSTERKYYPDFDSKETCSCQQLTPFACAKPLTDYMSI